MPATSTSGPALRPHPTTAYPAAANAAARAVPMPRLVPVIRATREGGLDMRAPAYRVRWGCCRCQARSTRSCCWPWPGCCGWATGNSSARRGRRPRRRSSGSRSGGGLETRARCERPVRFQRTRLVAQAEGGGVVEVDQRRRPRMRPHPVEHLADEGGIVDAPGRPLAQDERLAVVVERLHALPVGPEALVVEIVADVVHVPRAGPVVVRLVAPDVRRAGALRVPDHGHEPAGCDSGDRQRRLQLS